MSYILTKEQLLVDLYLAFECAKQHKKSKPYVIEFESRLHDNLLSLCNDLYCHTYKPQPSTCFIITHPKQREVFAAEFRDRIVHHLYFNYTHEIYERTFIQDSYSCIKDRGTHYGIHRLEKHIRKESHNYADNCYILKMDIKGYFMSINRYILLREANKTLDKMRYHKIHKWDNKKWNDIVDFKFIKYLTREIILLDPTIECVFKSNKEAWNGLSDSKSLFKTPKNCGLPIGNLTSQLFSNVYLNVLDQFMKRELHCKHYGRYVDDFYVVSEDKHHLHEIIAAVEQFMGCALNLIIQKGKTIINRLWQGVEFLGAYIKPYRTYISNQCLRRIKKNLFQVDKLPNPMASINSWLGVFSHYSSFNMRVSMFCKLRQMFKYGVYSTDFTKFIPMEKWKYGFINQPTLS